MAEPIRIVAPLPPGEVGRPYAVALAHVGGGSCLWTRTSGSLPQGITLNATGHLAGTPTAEGKARFTVLATKEKAVSKQTATVTFTLVVEPSALAVTTTSLPSAQVGVAYSETLAATGGVEPYNWSASGLPAGLTCSSAGVITGTPTSAGTDSVVLTVTDAG